AFLMHVLSRMDFARDLHFHTRTTIDTLDYSGEGLNSGSKVVFAAAGNVKRILWPEMPAGLDFPRNFAQKKIVVPGVLAVQAAPFTAYPQAKYELEVFAKELTSMDLNSIALIVLCDDLQFTAENINNFVWVCFTRSNPSHDIYGVNSFVEYKHWGCKGPLIIDARNKPHHAPPLEKVPEIEKRVDQLASRGGSLFGII